MATPPDKKTYFAYIHCRPDGAPFYVGKGHGRRAETLHGRSKWHASIVEKYGASSISVLKVKCASERAAFALEKWWIKCFRAAGEAICNLTLGGEGTSGRVESESTREKRRKFRHTPEAIEVMRQKRSMWKITDAHRAAMSAAHAGKAPSREAVAKMVETRKGYSHSEETRKKMSAAAKGRKLLPHVYDALCAANRARPGRKHTAEAKHRMSEIAKIREVTGEQLGRLRGFSAAQRKPIQRIDTGEQFEYARQLADVLRCTPSAVLQAARNHRTVLGVPVRFI